MKEKIKAYNTSIVVKNVTLGSNDLFHAVLFNTSTGKFEKSNDDKAKLRCDLLLDKVQHKESIDAILLAIETAADGMCKEFKNWDKKNLKGYSNEPRMIDGDSERYNRTGKLIENGYEKGKYILKVGSRPSMLTLINQRKGAVVESDELFYAGCEVSCKLTISPYVISNGITTYMNVIQFAKHGTPIKFGNSGDISDFDEIEDEDALGL